MLPTTGPSRPCKTRVTRWNCSCAVSLETMKIVRALVKLDILDGTAVQLEPALQKPEHS